MSDSNPSNPRPILKLKTRKSATKVEIPSPRQQSKLGQKPGAAFSDELMRRMQEDMDALLTR
jgi:hypothetical protein